MSRGAAREDSIAVLGAGSWGTALAIVLAEGERRVTLWGRDPERIASLRARRRNERYLPDAELPPALVLTEHLSEALERCSDVLVAVPSHAFRGLVVAVGRSLPPGAGLAWATKGFEPGTGRLLHEVAAELLPPGVSRAALSGPTFAAEVAARLPAAITVAADEPAHAARLGRALGRDRLRVYTCDDLVGVAVGGAVKNVMAIAAGISDALHFGANARAALVSRGLHEMSRLGTALGGRRETLMGLAGLGDLVLTCTDDQSRNRRLGLAVGRGAGVAEAQASIGQVVEGISAAREVVRLALAHEVEMPICEQVHAVLGGRVTPEEAVSNLFAREVGAEFVL